MFSLYSFLVYFSRTHLVLIQINRVCLPLWSTQSICTTDYRRQDHRRLSRFCARRLACSVFAAQDSSFLQIKPPDNPNVPQHEDYIRRWAENADRASKRSVESRLQELKGFAALGLFHLPVALSALFFCRLFLLLFAPCLRLDVLFSLFPSLSLSLSLSVALISMLSAPLLLSLSAPLFLSPIVSDPLLPHVICSTPLTLLPPTTTVAATHLTPTNPV